MTNITISPLVYEKFLRYLSNFHINYGNVACNKNVKPTELENVAPGPHLQISYLGSYTTNFNQTVTKMMQSRLATKASRDCIIKERSHFTDNFLSYYQIDLNQMFSGPSFLYPLPLHYFVLNDLVSVVGN